MTPSHRRSRLRVLLLAGALSSAVLQLHHAAAQQAAPAPVTAVAAAVSAPVTAAGVSPSPPPQRTATIMPIAPMIMPACPKGDILNSLNTREFPGRSWRGMNLEQQATHPINLVFMNLAGVPSTSRQGQFLPCLDSWGIKRSSVKRIKRDYRIQMSMPMSTEVLVMRTNRDVFVVFRATDDDWIADFTCLYTDDLRDKFNAPKGLFSKKLQLHKGFWTAYKAVDSLVMNEIKAQALMVKALNPFSTPQVWFIGHSLGGALGSIAALKLTLDPFFLGKVAGVVTYGMPRVGNEAWQSLYNDKLMDVTVRFENFRDLFAALPGKSQVCPAMNGKILYAFRHIGRAVQLCPDESTGMETFNYYPKGTEGECKEIAGQRPSIATHLIGAYFDGWRRAYAYKNGIPAGLLLSTSLQVRSVMCNQCAVAVKPYPLPTNKAARNDGIVTCVNDKSCKDKFVFGLVSWSGLMLTSIYRPDATCDAATMTCQVPIPGLQTVTNAITTLAPNITLADLAAAAGALWQNGTGGIIEQLQDFIGASTSHIGVVSSLGNISVHTGSISDSSASHNSSVGGAALQHKPALNATSVKTASQSKPVAVVTGNATQVAHNSSSKAKKAGQHAVVSTAINGTVAATSKAAGVMKPVVSTALKQQV